MINSNKIILTYGTFDMFHIGHLNLLRSLRSMGSKLVVGVSTDEFNAVKGKETLVPYAERASIVAAIRYVDEVFPERDWEQKEADIARYKADVFAMGNDWTGKFDYLSNVCQVVYLPRTEGISTTEIKNLSRTRLRKDLEHVLLGSEQVSTIVGTLLGRLQ